MEIVLEDLLRQIGDQLYTKRHLLRKKITTVANDLDISHSIISQIENGRYASLNLKLLTRLANYYGISLEELTKDN